MKIFDQALGKKKLGYDDNKKIPIHRIEGIEIKNFRSIRDQVLALGSNITVLSGRNGTMKTSLMGLIAHPFTSIGKDVFGKTLKTTLREVFKFSPTHDANKYEYDLILRTENEKVLREPVSIYYVGDNTERHRVVVSGSEKGDGNFSFNTAFLNLKRLYPIVDTEAEPDTAKSLQLKPDEAANLKDFYKSVFPSSEYDQFKPVHQKDVKTTFAPTGKDVLYDWHAISSGEDNLGAIFNRLLGFQRSFKTGQKFGNGILCVDEFDSSLHPVAQVNLFDYLYRWSLKYKVQIVLSTHSLYLISHVYHKHKANLGANRIAINFVSKSKAANKNYPILRNPEYGLAYKELTLQDAVQVAEARKIRIFCEDDFAVHFAKRLIKSQDVLRAVEFHSTLNPKSDTPGTTYSALRSLCIQFPLLLERSLVIFDADVTDEVTSKIKNNNLYLTLPDENGLAIERRIIIFILDLDNDDPFFLKFKNEREFFLNQFKSAGLKSLTRSDIMNANKISIEACKRWAELDKAKFRQYVTYYCDIISEKFDFRDKFIKAVNKINASYGMPEIL